MKHTLHNLFYIILAIATVGTSILLHSCSDDSVSPNSADSQIIAIVDEQNVGVAGAIAEVVIPGENFLLRDTSDENGFIRIRYIDGKKSSSLVRIAHDDFDSVNINLTDALTHSKTNPLKMKHLSSCTGRLTVIVRKASDSTLVPGATIRLNRSNQRVRQAVTNENGQFTFDNVCADAYWIRIARDGYAVVEQSVFVYGDTSAVSVYISPHSGADTCCQSVLVLNLRNKYTGALVDSVNVRLRKGAMEAASASSINGTVKFRELCNGDYNLRIAADGYKVLEFSCPVNCGDSLVLDKLLTPNECCTNKFTLKLTSNLTGEPVPNVKLTMQFTPDSTIVRYTDANGKYVFENFCAGKYPIGISKEGYKWSDATFYATCDEDILAEKILIAQECCSTSVKIVLKDENGQYLPDASVSLHRSTSVLPSKITDAYGSVQFDKVCESEYRAVCMKTNYQTLEFSFSANCHDTLAFEKTMIHTDFDTCCTETIRLRIKDANTEANLSNAIIKIISNGETIRTIASNVEGWATAELLCAPHTYTFVVSRDGYQTKEITINTKNCTALQETVKLSPAR